MLFCQETGTFLLRERCKVHTAHWAQICGRLLNRTLVLRTINNGERPAELGRTIRDLVTIAPVSGQTEFTENNALRRRRRVRESRQILDQRADCAPRTIHYIASGCVVGMRSKRVSNHQPDVSWFVEHALAQTLG